MTRRQRNPRRDPMTLPYLLAYLEDGRQLLINRAYEADITCESPVRKLCTCAVRD